MDVNKANISSANDEGNAFFRPQAHSVFLKETLNADIFCVFKAVLFQGKVLVLLIN